MKYYLVALFSLLGITSLQAYDGKTLTVGSKYLIYNIGQKKFLQCSSNGATLSAGGTSFTFTLASDSCFYLTPDTGDKLTEGHNAGLSGTTYDNWNLELAIGSETANAYVIASREREMNAFAYLTYSPATSDLASNPERPNTTLANGLWLLVKAGYYLGDVDGDGDVDFDDVPVFAEMLLQKESTGLRDRGDVNKDNKLGIGDETIIIKIANKEQDPEWVDE